MTSAPLPPSDPGRTPDGRPASLNFSAAFLARASIALDREELVLAACLLRHAVLLQLRAECEWRNCPPHKQSHKTSAIMFLQSLQRSGHCDDRTYNLVEGILTHCHRLAHCERIPDGTLEVCIDLVCSLIEHDPCCQPANVAGLPKRNACDREHDRGEADWWKPEGWRPQF